MKAAGYAGYDRVAPEKIYYARGTIQFWYNDLDQALVNMKRVTARAQDLDLNTITFAWLRVGQIYDLTGQRALAVQAYRQTVRLAPDSDAAKLSREYLSAPYRRPKGPPETGLLDGDLHRQLEVLGGLVAVRIIRLNRPVLTGSGTLAFSAAAACSIICILMSVLPSVK